MQLANASSERLILAPSRSFCPTLCVSAARSLPKHHRCDTYPPSTNTTIPNLRDRRGTAFHAVRCVGNVLAPNDAPRSRAPTQPNVTSPNVSPFTQRTAWERDDASFALVLSVFLLLFPSCNRPYTAVTLFTRGKSERLHHNLFHRLHTHTCQTGDLNALCRIFSQLQRAWLLDQQIVDHLQHHANLVPYISPRLARRTSL